MARPGGAIAAGLEAAAVASPRGSKSFALPGATVSFRSYPRGQARSGQDWKGAGNIGRWCGASTMVQVAEAWTLTAVLGRWPADRLGRSSQGLSCHQWLEWELEASPVDRSAGGILPACEQKFGLDLKEAGFDRAGTPKSPEQAC
jgi:hypothetical protein